MKKKAISITINGVERRAEVEPRLLLVHFLRENAGLTGTHIGCESSLCGACTVLLAGPGTSAGKDSAGRNGGGRAVKSCTVLAVQADGCAVTTIEGLASKDAAQESGGLSAVQQGFWDEHGLQCGYCTPGMIMSATDLLARHALPSDREIREALGGNICRCTGYQNIVGAVRSASKKMAGRKAAAGGR